MDGIRRMTFFLSKYKGTPKCHSIYKRIPHYQIMEPNMIVSHMIPANVIVSNIEIRSENFIEQNAFRAKALLALTSTFWKAIHPRRVSSKNFRLGAVFC